jgi:hypothetical protein
MTSGPHQSHARPWSSVTRFATTSGPVWFKAGAAGTRQEPGLLALLADRVPTLVPEPLAVDTERGWSLTRDGGPILRQVLAPAQSWDAWEGVLRRYADAQTRLADDRDDVLATGVREVSAATVPRQARALLDDLGARPVAEGGLTPAEAARLAAVLPLLDSWCAELAASPVPDSVQHDDVHSANVCWTGSVATARIIDWGDAVWGFPLTTMLGTMNSVAFHAGLYADGQPVLAPEVLRVRDAYLEPFTALAPRADLVRQVRLARRTGCVGKAMAYRAALDGEPLSADAGLGFPAPAWLLALLDDAPGPTRR